MSEKKKPGRPRGRKRTIPLQVRIPPDLAGALDELVASTRRSKNIELIIALENHLRAANLWPRKKQGGSADEPA